MKATIIRVPDAGPGLLLADTQQRPFTLDGTWRSAVAPQLNMAVELVLDAAGAIESITALTPAGPQSALSEAPLAIARGIADRLTTFCAGGLNALLGRMQEQHEQALWWSTYNAVLSGLAARHGVVDSGAHAAATEVANNAHGMRRQPPHSLSPLYRPDWSLDLT